MRLLKASILGVAGAMTTGRIASSLLETAGAVDELAKTSDRLGIGIDRLSGLRFAAEQTGVEVRTLDMALQRMTRRVSEAAKGTGEAKDAIKELGLDAVALNALDPADAFGQIADAMARVPTQADRVRLSFKLFDSEGVKLVNTLAQGSAGLKDLEAQAKSLGIVISREEAAKVEKFNDSLNALSKLIGGLKTEIAITMAPGVERTISAMTEILQGYRKMREAGVGFFDRRGDSDVNRMIALGNGIDPNRPTGIRGFTSLSGPQRATVPRLTQPQIDARAREQAISGFTRSLTGQLSDAIDPKKWADRLRPAFARVEEALTLAQKIGVESQRRFTMNAFRPREPLGEKPEEPKQPRRQQIVKAINQTLVKGSFEAIRAEQARDRNRDKIPKMQLAEDKKQTQILGRMLDTQLAGLVTVTEAGL